MVGQQRPHSVNTGDLGPNHRSSNLRKRNFHAASSAIAKGSGDLANRHQRPLLKKKKTRLDDVDDQLAQPARAFIRYLRLET